MIYFVLGTAAFIYGNLNLLATRLGWEALLRPREKLRTRHGQERGDVVFLITYVMLPLIVAAVAIWRGLYPA